MLKIRRNVFETNSSSSHSITFSNRSNESEPNHLPIDPDGYIHMRLGEFGWEIATYFDQYNKLSYLLTMCAELNGIDFWCINDSKFEESLEEFYDCDDFQLISGVIAEYAKCDGIKLDRCEGYIDHQSHEEYSSIPDFLMQNDTDIIDFVYGSVIVNTDNDNH